MSPEEREIPSPDGPSKTCPECRGRGWVDNRCLTPDHAHMCSYCNGKGISFSGKPCVPCRGTGMIEVRQIDRNPCPLCSGAGVYPVPESMTLREFAYLPHRTHSA
jgi:RecJ-like exonuclease